MEEHEEIAEIIRKIPLVHPPEALTSQIMARIGDLQHQRFYIIKNYLTKPRQSGFNPVAAMKDGTTREECFLYFMMAGFTHLILALVLFWGFRNFHLENQTIFWLRIQPQIVLFLTGLLIIAGIALLVGPIGIKLSILMSSAYLSIVSFNGILLISLVNEPIFRIPVIGLFGATFLTGIFLILIIKKHLEKNYLEKRIL